MNKKKKIITYGIIIAIFCILIILKIIFNKSTKENLEEYIKNIGFEKIEDNLYSKQISEISIDEYFKLVEKKTYADSSYYYFNTTNYTLSKVRMKYSNNISSTLNATYHLFMTSQIQTQQSC